MNKTLNNSTVKQAKTQVIDLEVVGDGDMFKLGLYEDLDRFRNDKKTFTDILENVCPIVLKTIAKKTGKKGKNIVLLGRDKRQGLYLRMSITNAKILIKGLEKRKIKITDDFNITKENIRTSKDINNEMKKIRQSLKFFVGV